MANAYMAENHYNSWNNNIYNRDDRRLLCMQSQRSSLGMVLTEMKSI